MIIPAYALIPSEWVLKKLATDLLVASLDFCVKVYISCIEVNQ